MALIKEVFSERREVGGRCERCDAKKVLGYQECVSAIGQCKRCQKCEPKEGVKAV